MLQHQCRLCEKPVSTTLHYNIVVLTIKENVANAYLSASICYIYNNYNDVLVISATDNVAKYFDFATQNIELPIQY